MCTHLKKNWILSLLIVLIFIPQLVSAAPGTPILGKPTTTVYQMKEWATAEEATPLFIELAPVFYEVAVQYGIDPAVIYTQSAKETNFMKFTGVLDASFFNPCGLKTTAGGSNADPQAHKRFTSWEEGITAMAHHLALYAGHPDFPMKETPDPRHFPSIYAKAPTVELLGGKWAPSSDYGNDIVRRMTHLYTMPTKPVFRLAGANRYETAANVANYNNRLTRFTIIANGDKPSDALVAASLARYLDASILLTQTGTLPEATLKELKKNESGNIILLGGIGSIQPSLEKTLKDSGLKVERIAGKERYDTSVQIQKYLETKSKKVPTTAILASGTRFADALAIAPHAAKEQFPIYLTNGTSLTPEVRAQLLRVKNILIVGGSSSVSKELESELRANGIKVERIAGSNRYDTSLQIAKTYFPNAVNFYAANGEIFADALVGAPVAAKYSAPILLMEKNRIPSASDQYLAQKEILRIAVLGGSGSLSDTVFSRLVELQ